MTSPVLKNAFTILMNEDFSPYALLTNENEIGLFKKLIEDDKTIKFVDYCSVEIGQTLEYLYRILWDLENRIYCVNVYKITDKISELVETIKCDDLEIRFLMTKQYLDKKNKEIEEKEKEEMLRIGLDSCFNNSNCSPITETRYSLSSSEEKEIEEELL